MGLDKRQEAEDRKGRRRRRLADRDAYKGERVAAGMLLGHSDIHTTRLYADDVAMETKIEATGRIPKYFSMQDM